MSFFNRVQKAYVFLKSNGVRRFVWRVKEEFKPKQTADPLTFKSGPKPMTIDEALDNRFQVLRALPGYTIPETSRRLNLVVDSINSGSLFGGVGTSIILAALLTKKWDCELRVLTRTEIPLKSNFKRVLEANSIVFEKNVEFIFTPPIVRNTQLPIGPGDIFLTTSWWTTKATLNGINPRKIIYLIQEDERTFYPFGDDYLLCSEVLSNPELFIVVNSKLLYDHFVHDGFLNMQKRGVWFEPSFPENLFYFEEQPNKLKQNFFFYSRPNNMRNLYYLGLEVISEAIKSNILDPARWDIYMIGKDIQPLLIGENQTAPIFQNLNWIEYARLVRKMDLGLSLMYSPHPSYPPLDLAGSGAVVVTNRYGVKESLDRYSRNILCCDLTVQDLLEGLQRGVSLSMNMSERLENYRNSSIGRSWDQSFFSVIERLSKEF